MFTQDHDIGRTQAGHEISRTQGKRMPERLSDDLVKRLPAPAKGNRVTYDDAVTGFGVRVTAAGRRTFVLNYFLKGRERRYTIGDVPTWTTAAARLEASKLRRRIDVGEDPQAMREEERNAVKVAAVADDFLAEHVATKREATQRMYRDLIERWIKPEIGRHAIATIDRDDVVKLRKKIGDAGKQFTANRTLAVLSRMFTFAAQKRLRVDNPVKGIERFSEAPRERFLTSDEAAAVFAALDAYEPARWADAVRLLIFTGARSGELLLAEWSQFDLDRGVWSKPSAHTKQARRHVVPLSDDAVAVLQRLREADPKGTGCLWPQELEGRKIALRRCWHSVRKSVGIEDVRVHDLRHSFAAALASSGASLHVVGGLLGHTQPATTARYAHLFDDVLRAATQAASASLRSKIVTKPDPAAPGEADPPAPQRRRILTTKGPRRAGKHG